MKREIKFEYGFESVNGIVKKKYYLHEIPLIQSKCDVWNDLPIVYVRQFTGLKDKNGKEVYENDILETVGLDDGRYFKSSVKYEEKEFICCDGFEVYDEDILQYQDNCIEIIGNTFENPELLTK